MSLRLDTVSLAVVAIITTPVFSAAQDRQQAYWNYVRADRMIYSCDNLDWEYRAEFDGSSKACVSFACDYKSPTMTVLTKDAVKLVTLVRLNGSQKILASKTEEERSFSKRFSMSAKVLVLDSNEELATRASEPVTVVASDAVFMFAAPDKSEEAEAAWASFKDDCL